MFLIGMGSAQRSSVIQQIEEIVLGEGGDGGGGFGEGAGAGAGFIGKQGSVGELAGELALSMLKLQDTFFDGVLGPPPDTR